MQRDTTKLIVAALFSIYFLWCAYDLENVVFMHLIHLPIHEAGHIIFMILGRFMTVAGGSLFQVIVPIVFFGYFVYHEKPFSASIILFWVGSAILDVYIYANDAVVMQLVLLGGLTGSEGGAHDWNYLLTETGLIDSTPVIAKMIKFAGILTTVAAVIGSFVYARKGEGLLPEIGQD